MSCITKVQGFEGLKINVAFYWIDIIPKKKFSNFPASLQVSDTVRCRFTALIDAVCSTAALKNKQRKTKIRDLLPFHALHVDFKLHPALKKKDVS